MSYTMSLPSSQAKVYELVSAVVINIILLTISAKIIIPIAPVPVTMQTLAILVISLTHSRKIVIASVLGWIGLAAMGVPVLLGPVAGAVIFTGKTAGYIIAFPIAAYFLAYLKDKGFLRSYTALAFACSISLVIIYTLGVAWLSQFIGLKAAFIHGCLVFIPSGTVKLVVALSIVKKYGLLRN